MSKTRGREAPAQSQAKPLTFTNTDGILYRRSGETERQIAEALACPPEELVGRAACLNEEALVYFIRECHDRGDHAVVRKLMEALMPHCDRIIYSVLRPLWGLDAFEEARAEILKELAEGLVGPPCRGSDFLQVRFGVVLKSISIDALKKWRTYARRFHAEDPTAAAFEGTTDGRGVWLCAPVPLPNEAFETRTELEAALGAIRDDQHRDAFVLHLEGWPAGSSDPEVPTISGRFGVTERTIHTWLREAQKDIEKHLGRRR